MDTYPNSASTSTKNKNGGILGRGLRHRKMSPSERAQLAAAVVTGECSFTLSHAQAAMIFGITARQLCDELKARAEPAVEIIENVPDLIDCGKVTAIVDAWIAASEAERKDAVRALGPGSVWDTLSSVVA
jgi:hypothetical protein